MSPAYSVASGAPPNGPEGVKLGCLPRRIFRDVLICRGDEDTTWALEVVDDAANSYVWDEQFAFDQAAMEEFLASVESEGMKQYNPYYRSDLH